MCRGRSEQARSESTQSVSTLTAAACCAETAGIRERWCAVIAEKSDLPIPTFFSDMIGGARRESDPGGSLSNDHFGQFSPAVAPVPRFHYFDKKKKSKSGAKCQTQKSRSCISHQPSGQDNDKNGEQDIKNSNQDAATGGGAR